VEIVKVLERQLARALGFNGRRLPDKVPAKLSSDNLLEIVLPKLTSLPDVLVTPRSSGVVQV